MAIRYYAWSSIPETPGATHNRFVFCDTWAERPVTGLRVGDILYAADVGKLRTASDTTTWITPDPNSTTDTLWAAMAGTSGTPSGTNKFVTDADTRLSGGTIPAGLICLWSGLLANVPSGWALCDGTSGTPDLRDKFIKGWAAGVDPGGTGGAATHSHGVGTYAVSAHSGAAVGDHASHTHTYTEIVNHTHPVTDPGHVHAQRRNNVTTGGNTGWTAAFDTSSSSPVNDSNTGTASNTTGITTGNPVGGVASGTTAGPGATLTHSVTQPDAHTLSGSSASVNHEPTYFKLAYIMKT